MADPIGDALPAGLLKPLVWKEIVQGSSTTCHAKSALGTYEVFSFMTIGSQPRLLHGWRGPGLEERRTDSLDAAKRAAEDDRRDRMMADLDLGSLSTLSPAAPGTQSDREVLEALAKALIGPDEVPSRLSWLEGYKAQVDAVVEDDEAFREAWEGDDPSASSECEREVAGLLRDVRPALEAASRHLGLGPLEGRPDDDDSIPAPASEETEDDRREIGF